ncbi:MAG: Zn-dependent protease with chaperone function [Halocynthiibacter sp.]|jgi:Zn-dependent protease with chaperone function
MSDENTADTSKTFLAEPSTPSDASEAAPEVEEFTEAAAASAPPTAASAYYLNGTSATLFPAYLALDGEGEARVLTIRLEPPKDALEGADTPEPQVWRMQDLRAVPGQADKNTLIVTHVDQPLARLLVQGPQARSAIKSYASNLAKRPPVRGRGRIAQWALAAAASVVLIVFVLVPLMANQLAPLLPPEGEKALGDATYEQIRKALAEDFVAIEECESEAGSEALVAMRSALEEYADLPYDMSLTVLDHKMVNAFALPGGRVVLFRGLIDNAENPNEVAAVLAHEMGHVVSRDPTRHALRSAGSFGVLGLLFGDFAGGTAVLLVANQLIEASYSQGAESAADGYAHGVLAQAQVTPASIGTFFARMRDEYGDDDGFVAHFLSHPSMGDRIEKANAAAEAAGVEDTPIISAKQWADLQSICR